MTCSLKRPAVFLDRDGTLSRDRDGRYVTRPGMLKIYKNTPKALAILKSKGLRLIVVTNQSAIARGYMTKKTALSINKRLAEELKKHGARLDGIYFCPHGPDENCACRKPASGMILKAAAEHKIDLKKSYIIGDKLSDIKAGKAAGVKTVFVLTGHGKSRLKEVLSKAAPDYTAKDILSAAKWIIKDGRRYHSFLKKF